MADIYHLLDEDTDHEPSEENLDWIAGAFKDLLRSRLSARERRSGGLRFSNLGTPDRKLWYQAHKPELAERMIPKTYMKFLYGDLIELLQLFLAKEAGHEVTHLQHEVEIDGVKGHLDAVIDGVTVDSKSASPMSYSKFQTGRLFNDDPFGYLEQISGYASCTTPEQGAAFLAADKVDGGICLLKVPPEKINEFDTKERITHLKEVLKNEKEPERCYDPVPEGKSGNLRLGTNCSYCPFKFHCWRDSNDGRGLLTYQYAKGPVFMTKVVKEPKVDKIEPF